MNLVDATTGRGIDPRVVTDFKFFLAYAWKWLRLPFPTEMQLEIADFLQTASPRKQLEALRGIGKTWITGAFACWKLLRNPNEKILIISQSGTFADRIASFIKRLIHLLPVLAHLKARGDQKDATAAFDVDGCEVTVQASVTALGITGQLQGNRATILISDDVEGRINSATEDLRTKLKDATAEYEAIIQTDEGCEVIILGTPQSSESIYNGFREDGYLTRIFPARYPADISAYHGCLAPYITKRMTDDPTLIGKPIDSRFTEVDLTRREGRYGKSGFRLQFMIDTSMSDAERFPLKLKDLVVLDLDNRNAPLSVTYSSASADRIKELPNIGFVGDGFFQPSYIADEQMLYELIYMAIDPAGRGKDALGYSIVGQLHGKLYLLDAGGLFGGYGEENLVKLSILAAQFDVNKIFIEDNFGDGMFRALLSPIMRSIHDVSMEDIKHSTQKELRIIDTLEPVMNSHRLVVDKGLIAKDISYSLSEEHALSYGLFYQLSHITKERGSLGHDDVLDSLAMVVKQFMRLLIQSPVDVLQAYKDKRIDANIELFMDIVKKRNHKENVRPATACLSAFKRK